MRRAVAFSPGQKVWVTIGMGRGKKSLIRSAKITRMGVDKGTFEVEFEIEVFGHKRTVVPQSRIVAMEIRK